MLESMQVDGISPDTFCISTSNSDIYQWVKFICLCDDGKPREVFNAMKSWKAMSKRAEGFVGTKRQLYNLKGIRGQDFNFEQGLSKVAIVADSSEALDQTNKPVLVQVSKVQLSNASGQPIVSPNQARGISDQGNRSSGSPQTSFRLRNVQIRPGQARESTMVQISKALRPRVLQRIMD